MDVGLSAKQTSEKQNIWGFQCQTIELHGSFRNPIRAFLLNSMPFKELKNKLLKHIALYYHNVICVLLLLFHLSMKKLSFISSFGN